MNKIKIFGVPHLKGGSGIHIKEENKGKFTASAKAAGQSVQEHAKSVLNDPNATPLQKKRANFARNAKKWKHEEGAKIHKPDGHRAITDNGWIPTKRLKKGTYGLIKKHKEGGPAENNYPAATRDNTYVQPFLISLKISRYKPEIKTEPIVDNRSEALKRYTETFYRLGGKDLSTRRRKARADEANKYLIPYIPEKEIRLTTDRYNTGKISTNLLDSIYNASQRTGVPFDIALGLAGRESTLGIGRGFKKGSSVSGTDLYSNWQLILPIINNNKTINKANALFARIRNNELLNDEEFNILTNYLENVLKELNSTKAMEENPIDNALRYYISGKYNPGDKKHTLMVENDARILMTDPAIRKWMLEKGLI